MKSNDDQPARQRRPAGETNMPVAFFLAVLATVGRAALESGVRSSPGAGSLPQAPALTLHAASKQQAPGEAADPNRVLLDSLGGYPGATQTREYVLNESRLGRGYATEIPLEESAPAVTDFYEQKLLAQGWEVLDRHAAISSYVKGNRIFLIIRSGPADPGAPPGSRLLKSTTPPPGARFFFNIEAGPRPLGTAPATGCGGQFARRNLDMPMSTCEKSGWLVARVDLQ
jgi:hypothetical protein